MSTPISSNSAIDELTTSSAVGSFGKARLDPRTGIESVREGQKASIAEESQQALLEPAIEGEGEIDVKSDDGDGGFYKQGTTVKLVAKPAANFDFKEWSGEVTGGTGNATNSVTVLRNSNVTATFVKKDAK